MMRRVFSIVVLLFVGAISLNAQSYDEEEPMAHRHEVKFNLGKGILGRFPEVEYEYILKPDMGVGGRLGFGLGDKSTFRYTLGDVQAMPFFRWYFTASGDNARQVAKGFFAEVNMAFTSYKTYVDAEVSSQNNKAQSAFGAGVGMGIGWKYVSRSGWTCDIKYGAGRNFSGPVQMYGVGGVTIGKRF